MKSRAVSRDRLFTSCLISAPFGMDLGNLTRVLDEMNIQWEWAKSNLAHSERLPGDLRKIIRGVDFVIGVFMGDRADTNTMFEIGMAVGAGKPVLLLMADDTVLPLNLETLPQLRASLKDTKAIELHLDLLRRSGQSGFRYPTSSRIPSTTVSSATVEPGKFSRGDKAASAFEAEVAAAIEEAGGDVVFHPRMEGAKFRPDMLFWLPKLDAELLNPAVIETKGNALNATQLGEAAQQVFAFLQQTGVRTGLVISQQTVSRPVPSDFRPLLNVFILDLQSFRDLLRNSRLAEYLREERNRAAHGLR